MKKILPLAGVLVVGIGLGFLLFGRGGKEPRPREPPGGARGVAAPCLSRGVVRGPGMEADRGGGTVPKLAGRLDRSLRERHLQLLRDNKRLASRLSEVEQELRFAQGSPMKWPATSPPRLSRKAVVAALNKALGELGLSGEVTDVDCKEYPCVLAGSLKGRVTAQRFQAVLGSDALRAYRDDHAQTSITNRSGHDSLGRPWVRSHFAMALMMAGPHGTDPDVKRTVYRLRQLLDATIDQ